MNKEERTRIINCVAPCACIYSGSVGGLGMLEKGLCNQITTMPENSPLLSTIDVSVCERGTEREAYYVNVLPRIVVTG